jgi:ketosteroid isomerase-like protein
MPSDTELLERLYDRFNARDMDAALAALHPDVVWANALEGGHVHGHDGVRDYWTRPWATMDSRAEPLGFSVDENGTVSVEVHLIVHDLSGNVLLDRKAVHLSRSRTASSGASTSAASRTELLSSLPRTT